MSIEEMKTILNKAKKDFKRKTRVNKLMIGQTEEVAKETERILKEVLLKNIINVVSEEMHVEDIASGPVDEEVKEDIVEDTQIPLDVHDTKIPMEIEAPKVLSVKEKEMSSGEVEVPKGKKESVAEETMVEENKVEIKELLWKQETL